MGELRPERDAPSNFSAFFAGPLRLWPAKVLLNLNPHFLFLLALLLWIDHPYWPSSYWPAFDGLSVIGIFHAYYNDFFLYGDLVRWIPYGNYGFPPAFHQLGSLTPASYLSILLGKLFGVQNFMHAFKFSMFLEELAFLGGLYKLSKLFFRHRTTLLFVALCALAGTVWIVQIPWNFRIAYLLPWVLYFLIRFFQKKGSRYLWLSGTVSAVSILGVPPYFAFLHSLIYLFFFIFLWLRYRPGASSFRLTRRSDWLCLAGFLVFLAALGYMAFTMFDGIVHFVFHRDPKTMMNSAETFVNYGPHPGFSKLLGLFFPYLGGKDSLTNITHYTGLFSLLFLLYALVKARGSFFAPVLFLLAFMICFSASDTTFIPRALYELFPPIRFFRYTGATGALIRLFLVLSAGFGVDQFLEDLKKTPADGGAGRKRFFFCFLGLMGLILWLDFRNADGKLFAREWPEFTSFSRILLGLGGLVLSLRWGLKARHAGFLILLLSALEMLSYQNLVQNHWPFNYPWIKQEAVRVHHYEYQPERKIWENEDPRFLAANEVSQAGNQRMALETFSYLQFDPCIPLIYHNSYWIKGVDELLKLRWPLFKNAPDLERGPELPAFMADGQTPLFLKTFGCQVPKLRLVTDVKMAANPEEAHALASSTPDLSETPVISDYPQTNFPASPPGANPAGEISVKFFSFNELAAEVNVIPPGGAWLYYADAYHPGWKAWINGKRVPVARANLGFKALRLEAGRQNVRLYFFDGPKAAASWLVALSGVLISLIMTGVTLKELFTPAK